MALQVFVGPFVAACALLAISGVEKLRRPEPARATLAAAGARVPAAAVVALGVFEVALAILGVAFGGVAAVLVGVAYLALAGFALQLLRRAPATPCSCLGSSTATVSPLHAVINLVAACTAFVAATGGSPLAPIAHHPVGGAVFVALVGCCVALSALALDALPVLQAAAKENGS